MNSGPSTRWSEAQRRIYGRVYRFMLVNQQVQTHPAMGRIPDEHWDTICHNAAWLAAELLEDGDFAIRDLDTNQLLSSKIEVH